MNDRHNERARAEQLELVQMIKPRINEIARLLEMSTSPADSVRRVAAGLGLSEVAARLILAQSIEVSLSGYRQASIAAELEELNGDRRSTGDD